MASQSKTQKKSRGRASSSRNGSSSRSQSRSNRSNGVTGILFTQREAMSPEPPPVRRDFWGAVNDATSA